MALAASSPTIRLAVNGDGERIRQLVATTQIDIPTLDWSDIYPYWIAAEINGQIVGCLNVALSKPIGRLDLLAVDGSLPPLARARVVKALIVQGLAVLKADGATATLSVVPFQLRSYRRILKKHFGAQVCGQGNMIVKGL